MSLIISKEINIEFIVRSIKDQIRSIQARHPDDFADYSLAEINKYVGYKSKYLDVRVN